MKAGLDPRPPGSSCVKISSPCGILAAIGEMDGWKKGCVFFGEGKGSPFFFLFFFGGRGLFVDVVEKESVFLKGFECE